MNSKSSPIKASNTTPRKPKSTAILTSGQVLAGSYEVVEQIGEGGMAVVYLAIQKSLNRRVAIKAMHPRFAKDEEFIARFEAEAGALASLQHPNIINIIDRGNENDVYYFVMEFVEGEDLDHKIVENRLTPQEWRDIVSACGNAFEYVHRQGIIHKDIKPSNILINRDGIVKVGDFGIAHIVGGAAAEVTATDRALGTRHYMAPEQEHAPATVDHRADIYSLAVTFYKMLTRRMPLDDFPMPSSLNPAIPLAVDEVLLKGMAADREQRYDSVKSFCDALSKALREKSVNMATMFKGSAKTKTKSSLYGGTDFQARPSSSTTPRPGKDSSSEKKRDSNSGKKKSVTATGGKASTTSTTASRLVEFSRKTATSADTAVTPVFASEKSPSARTVLTAIIVALLALAGIGGGIWLLLQEPPAQAAAPLRSVLSGDIAVESEGRQLEELRRRQNEERLQQILSTEIDFDALRPSDSLPVPESIIPSFPEPVEVEALMGPAGEGDSELPLQ